ncbi:hypothetical protein BLS_000708 [Venturia inaequalis]|uniref:Uncharacterized protein n=1 Tax=Venturia inaequalis TaxID=5025 RepID=A0A8H3U4N1_VENIN|nr:hypothetical protein BLS_000708 [Venturia inaequalis]
MTAAVAEIDQVGSNPDAQIQAQTPVSILQGPNNLTLSSTKFFDLPLELRQKIYWNCLSDSCQEIYQHRSVRSPQTPEKIVLDLVRSHKMMQINNRQIRNEYSDFAKTHIIHSISIPAEKLNELDTWLGDFPRNDMRRLKLTVIWAGEPPTSTSNGHAHLSTIATFVSSLELLTHLQILWFSEDVESCTAIRNLQYGYRLKALLRNTAPLSLARCRFIPYYSYNSGPFPSTQEYLIGNGRKWMPGSGGFGMEWLTRLMSRYYDTSGIQRRFTGRMGSSETLGIQDIFF